MAKIKKKPYYTKSNYHSREYESTVGRLSNVAWERGAAMVSVNDDLLIVCSGRNRRLRTL